jgi:hypothetical protein
LGTKHVEQVVNEADDSIRKAAAKVDQILYRDRAPERRGREQADPAARRLKDKRLKENVGQER